METDSAASSETGDREFRLQVINPGGRDQPRSFENGAGAPSDPGHAPVNFHAYAACTRGSYTNTPFIATQPPRHPVLLLLRHDLKASEKALDQLLRQQCLVAVSLKETGSSQLASLLSNPHRLAQFRTILVKAHGVIAATPYLTAFYRGLLPPDRDPASVQFIPTPYPVGEPGWDFTVPLPERMGIFVGTREFKTPSRGHLAALATILPLARETGAHVSVFNTDHRLGDRLLAQLPYAEGQLRVHHGRRPYIDYLRIAAVHRLAFQLDASEVPGQVAGDCLLAGIPLVGGNGAVERIAFPDLHGGETARPPSTLLELARRLLTDDAFYTAQVAQAREIALRELAFPVIAQRLQTFYASLKG